MIGSDAPITPEQRLFVGVIANAAQEAAGARRNGDAYLMIKEAARAWFHNGGDDFRTVCELAGLEAREVRMRVLAYVEQVDADPDALIRMKRTKEAGRESRISIHDVAHLAGVSATTVSNVINDRPVSDATSARVRNAINKLGYVRRDH